MDLSSQPGSKRIVLTTFGSLGDLHPYLALAIGLKERGHFPVLATHGFYRSKVESEGIAFHTVAPDLTDFGDEQAFTRKAFSPFGGAEFLVRTVVVSAIQRAYADLDAAVGSNTDLIIGHPLTFAAALIAEKRGIPWLSVALAPASFLSAHDPVVFPQAPFLSKIQPMLGASRYGKLLSLLKRVPYQWTSGVRTFRTELGLPPSNIDPLFAGFSPYGTLALFSSALGAPQPDWPARTTQAGFCFYDKLSAGNGLAPEIAAFLSEGEPPIVFTLGSAAVMDAGRFYIESAAAAARIGQRAILLTGKDDRNIPPTLPPGVLAYPYAPYSELFPQAAINVHQGGVGTTGQALRAGRPQLVVPHGFDQPDNAYRMVQRGAGRTVSRYRYTAGSVARELAALLAEPGYARRAAALGEQVRAEKGVATACALIEDILKNNPARANG